MAKWVDWICIGLEAVRNMACFEIREQFKIGKEKETIKEALESRSQMDKEFGLSWEQWGHWMRLAVCLVDPRFFTWCLCFCNMGQKPHIGSETTYKIGCYRCVLYWAQSLSHVQLFVTPWTVACQASLSMGILQARILEWVAMPFSRGSSQLRDRTQVSHIAGGFFTNWANLDNSAIACSMGRSPVNSIPVIWHC